MPTSVLVLDPEPVFQNSVARKLRLHGMLVLTRPGFDGLASLMESFTFDAVIIDTALLRDGLEPLRQIMASRPAVAIVLTAAPEDAALVRLARELGIDGCLAKPIHPDALLRAIETRVAGGGALPDRPGRQA